MSQHDETRKMLELIREGSRKTVSGSKTFLMEQDINVQKEKPLDITEVKEEEKKFRDTVTPRVTFNQFKLYPKAQNVEWSGKFNDSNIEWYYSLDDTRGVYITNDLFMVCQVDSNIIEK